MATNKDGKSTADLAIEFIISWINIHPEEDKLPTEHFLTIESGYSRGTIRIALKQLEAQGRIVCLGGKGGRVVNRSGGGKQSIINQTVAILSPIYAEQFSEGPSSYMKLGVIDALQREGMHVFFINPHNCDKKVVLNQIKNTVGVIAFEYNYSGRSSAYSMLLDEIRDFGIPVVCYNNSYDMDDFDCVSNDHKKGTYDLTVKMIERGCRRILPIWTSIEKPKWLIKREEGYYNACKDNGIEPIEPISIYNHFPGSDNPEETMDAWVREYSGIFVDYFYKEKKIDGVMCITDRDCFAASEAIKKFHFDPRKDVLVVGFDNNWASCSELQVSPCYPVFTVEKSTYKTGEALVELFVKRLNNKLPKQKQSIIIPATVIETPAAF